MVLPVYLDHAATTPVSPDVLADMMPYFTSAFANPAALYTPGAEARAAVDLARDSLAEAISAGPEEIVFTSGGTESNNWALKGRAEFCGYRGHILTTPIEHSSILSCCDSLARRGVEVEYLPVDAEGTVDPSDVAARIKRETILVSVMHANNEVGTIEPIAEIGAACHDRGIPFHSDAVQTLGKIPISVKDLNVDLLSFSAHKLNGPKGTGALYVRRGTRLSPFMEGGEQEQGRRAGTLNVPGIVGLGSAVRHASDSLAERGRNMAALRDRLIGIIERSAPGARLCGARERRLPNNAHFCFAGVEGESLLLTLDADGICASAGSACSAGSTEPSHVLLALGLDVELARGAVRLTFGPATTWEALSYAADRLCAGVVELRSLAGSGGPVALTGHAGRPYNTVGAI